AGRPPIRWPICSLQSPICNWVDPALFARAVRVEAIRSVALVPSCQSVERQSSSHGGLHHRRQRDLSLRRRSSRSGATLYVWAGGAARRSVFGGADVDSLARSVEIRR